MVVTTTNSTHKPKDTELKSRTRAQYLNCCCSISILCLSLFGADSMIGLKLHVKKEGSLLQNMQHCSCNRVGMSFSCKIRCLHKRFCNTVPAVVIALGRPEPFKHSPDHINMKTPPPPPPPVMITYLLLLNESGHSHCISFAIAESGWSIVSTGVTFGFRCSTASLTKFMTQLRKATAWAFSSRSGIKPMLETGFSHEIYSLLVMG